jgi:hypothetical protein
VLDMNKYPAPDLACHDEWHIEDTGGLSEGAKYQNDARSRGKTAAPAPSLSPSPQTCDRCGRVYGFGWYTPDDLWARIEGTEGGPALCPDCFSADAEKAGEPLIWKADSPPHQPAFDAILDSARARPREVEEERDRWHKLARNRFRRWADAEARIEAVLEEVIEWRDLPDADRYDRAMANRLLTILDGSTEER